MAGVIAPSGTSSSPLDPNSAAEANANLDRAILAAKVTCVVLAVLVVVGFVLAVALSGAWMVVIPAMVLYAAATIAIPFALHFWCEASLAQASLAAQQGSTNDNTQNTSKKPDRSKMNEKDLQSDHLKDLKNLQKKHLEEANGDLGNPEGKEKRELELEKMRLEHSLERENRLHREELEKIDKEHEADQDIGGLEERCQERYKRRQEEDSAHRKKIEEIELRRAEINQKEEMLKLEEPRKEFEKKKEELEQKCEKDIQDIEKIASLEDDKKNKLKERRKDVFDQEIHVLDLECRLELLKIRQPDTNHEFLEGILLDAKKELNGKRESLQNEWASAKYVLVRRKLTPLSSKSKEKEEDKEEFSSYKPATSIERSIKNLNRDNSEDIKKFKQQIELEREHKLNYLRGLGAPEHEIKEADNLLIELNQLRLLDFEAQLIDTAKINNLSLRRDVLKYRQDIFREMERVAILTNALLEKIQLIYKRGESSSSSPLPRVEEPSSSLSSSSSRLQSMSQDDIFWEEFRRDLDLDRGLMLYSSEVNEAEKKVPQSRDFQRRKISGSNLFRIPSSVKGKGTQNEDGTPKAYDNEL